jgi:methylated-DNA-protein-cysteine methyltransferase related protein
MVSFYQFMIKIKSESARFKDKVLAAVMSVPPGCVASYGQIALMAGDPRAARQVGWILNKNGDKDNIPWWRIINNSGRISIKNPEYSAQMQRDLLRKEGVKVSEDFQIDIEKYRFRF